MSGIETVDVCILGDEPGGIEIAMAAAAFGLSVVVFAAPRPGLASEELRNRMAMLAMEARTAAAKAAGAAAWPAAVEAVQRMAAAEARLSSPVRLRALGVRVIEAAAAFADPRTVEAGDLMIRARHFVVAAGSAPFRPAIAGAGTAEALTPDSLWSLAAPPSRLAVVGGDATAAALAQGFRRFGSAVTLFAPAGLLEGFDPDMAATVRAALEADGVEVFDHAQVLRAEPEEGGIRLHAAHRGEQGSLAVSHLLIASGRLPALDGLGLDRAGIRHGPSGIEVDGAFRTANRMVFALGEAVRADGEPGLSRRQGALIAAYIAMRRPVSAARLTRIATALTDPQIAEIGLTESEARKVDAGCRVLRMPLAESVAARIAGEARGHLKLIVSGQGRLVGCAALGRRALDMAAPFALAVETKLHIRDLAAIQLPHPGVTEIGKRAAGAYFSSRISNPWIGRFLRLIRRFG